MASVGAVNGCTPKARVAKQVSELSSCATGRFPKGPIVSCVNIGSCRFPMAQPGSNKCRPLECFDFNVSLWPCRYDRRGVAEGDAEFGSWSLASKWRYERCRVAGRAEGPDDDIDTEGGQLHVEVGAAGCDIAKGRSPWLVRTARQSRTGVGTPSCVAPHSHRIARACFPQAAPNRRQIRNVVLCVYALVRAGHVVWIRVCLGLQWITKSKVHHDGMYERGRERERDGHRHGRRTQQNGADGQRLCGGV